MQGYRKIRVIASTKPRLIRPAELGLPAQKGFYMVVSCFSGTLVLVFISDLGMVGCAPLTDGTLILCCICAWRLVGNGAGEPSRCPAKGPGASGYSHILWHRHPATCVLTLAQHFSVLAQKNIIKLFYCFTVSGSCAIHHTRNTTSRELKTSD